MNNNNTEILKGVLEGIILEIISQKETYGYEITDNLKEIGFVDIVEGTVYTILLRLERNKLVSVEKKKSELGPPRKFYKLNSDGIDKLQQFWSNWEFISTTLDNIKENKDV